MCQACYEEQASYPDRSHALAIEYAPWCASATGFRCEACAHVMPWLHNHERSLCAKCSRRLGCF